jgi:hypothetical protein
MENKLDKWFDAAKQANPVISVQEIEAMIKTSTTEVRVKSIFKKYMIMGISLATLVGLTWMLNFNYDINYSG